MSGIALEKKNASRSAGKLYFPINQIQIVIISLSLNLYEREKIML